VEGVSGAVEKAVREKNPNVAFLHAPDRQCELAYQAGATGAEPWGKENQLDYKSGHERGEEPDDGGGVPAGIIAAYVGVVR
jgi:hypothetical protein